MLYLMKLCILYNNSWEEEQNILTGSGVSIWELSCEGFLLVIQIMQQQQIKMLGKVKGIPQNVLNQNGYMDTHSACTITNISYLKF